MNRIVRNAFALMEFQDGCGMLEIARLLAAALESHFAEVVHGLLELAGEALRMQAQGGQLFGVAGIWRPRNRDTTVALPAAGGIGSGC